MNVWNKRELPRPPDYTLEYCKQDLDGDLGMCVQSLLDAIQEGHSLLAAQEVNTCLQKEVGILTACLYRNGRHRTEKFYKALKKVEKTCARWHELCIAGELARLSSFLPAAAVSGRSVRLPSRQMFEYVVVRLLGSYHLLLHLDTVCTEAAGLLMAKVHTGHFFSTAVVFLAVVARIRALALDLAGQVAKTYEAILPWVSHVRANDAPSLVDTTHLPSSLTSLLHHHISFDHNQNPLGVQKATAGPSLHDSLSKERDNGKKSEVSTSKDKSTLRVNKSTENLSSKQGNIHFRNGLVEEDIGVCVENSLVEEDIGVCVEDSLVGLVEEDIGVCLENCMKPLKKQNAAKKMKPNLSDCGSSQSNTLCGKKAAKKTTKSVKKKSVVNSKKMKKKKETKKEILASVCERTSKSQNSKSNAVKRPESKDSFSSPAFAKLYKAVKKQTRSIESVGSLSRFLKSERKKRLEKVKERVSRLMKKEEWSKFDKYVTKRIQTIERSITGDSDVRQTVVDKTRVRVKFWLLFPHLSGKKPENWTVILASLKNPTT